MSTIEAAFVGNSEQPTPDSIVNDFSIQVATVNGSGSQTANLVLLRALFQMGIPVSGKNLFPSNIAGLPTWYTIRISKHGYIGRKEEIDLLVAMNAETAKQDVLDLSPGAVVVYDLPLEIDSIRTDLYFYPVPFDELVKPVCRDAKLRRLVRNVIYDGVLAWLLGIDLKELRKALFKQFSTKPKAADLNWSALEVGYEFAKRSLVKKDPFCVERMECNEDKIIIEGNAAAALGALFAGVTVVTWYPITPSSSLAESLAEYCQRYRIDSETGKATFAIVQAEDEIAAIGMAVGAGWAGARAMTATAGPGISLMSEFIGLGYFSEIPVVIFDVQRMGPSTGLPTRTSQGDLLACATLSHGDTKHPLLIPSHPEECYQMAIMAFDLAEQIQSPVFVMLDLDLGMNYWTSDKFKYPQTPLKRGKVLTADDLDRLNFFRRYHDIDGDGICYRTLPGTNHHLAPYFTRGTGHNEDAQYSERPFDWVSNIDRLSRKFVTIRNMMPKPEVDVNQDASVGLIGCGTSHYAIQESRQQLLSEHKLKSSYARVKSYPFGEEIATFISQHDRVYIVDQNHDGQLRELILREISHTLSAKLLGICYYTGLPLDARTITNEIAHQEGM